jgi:hypothetical protein
LHRFRDQCPWYQRHLAIGTAHVNKNRRLAYRPPCPNALEFFLQRRRLEGTQVVIATAGTLEDENIKNRPKPSLGASVASITLVSSVDSNSDKEEIKVF